MPSERVYAFGQPQNDGERRVIAFLDEHLPSGYRIYHSLERESAGQTYEWDVIVAAPHAVFCLEVKDWPGSIRGNDREWVLQNGAVRRSPYPLIAHKSRVLKNQLVAQTALLNVIWVEPLVVIADDRTTLDLKGMCAAHTVTLQDLTTRVTDSRRGQYSGADIRTRLPDVDRLLRRDYGPIRPVREIAHFRLLEPVTATDLYTEWRACNRFAPESAPMRLKIYAPDPYRPAAQLEQQLNLIKRDFQAAMRMGSHPHLRAARDFFPDEGGRWILVLDDFATRSLEAELLAGRSFTYEQKLRIVEDVADGLAHAHACKIVHRDVRPGNIWPSSSGSVLANFDCARIGNGNTVSALIEAGLDDRYLAPEVRHSPSAATAASDAYALGVVLYELLSGQLPAPAGQRQPLTAFDALIDQSLDRLVSQMLADEADQRPAAVEVRDALAALRDQRRSPTQGSVIGEGGARLASGVDFAVGDQIEREYLVRDVLGEGSFGKVYRVYSAVTNREYAMKIFRDPGLGLEDAQKEFDALARLQHRRIARVWHAAQLQQGAYYLLTDCISGQPLHRLIGDARPAPMEALHYVADLLDALMYLHSKGYVHRDIKPSNIVVSPEGAWLIDFNIAVRTSAQPAERAGTPLYTPPDVASCGDEPTRDLFAAGIVLFEMLTGQHPYGGPPRPGSTLAEPQQIEPRLTNQMAAVLRRAVDPQAAERYASADEFLTALRAVDEPLMPPVPDYPRVRGISLAPDERVRPNHNPYLHRLQTLYSQNRLDNSGTRGYDEVSQATYVRTRLDKQLISDIVQGRFRLLIVTGNAGDGKTALLQRLEQLLSGGYEGYAPMQVTAELGGNGSRFELNGRTFRTNYDGSQDEIEAQNDDVLAEFFAPFAGNEAEIAPRTDEVVRLIAINEGKLREFLEHAKARFPWLAAAIGQHLDKGAPLPTGYAVVNLNDRSLVAGEPSIVDQQIAALCDPVFWEPCSGCAYVTRCPVKFNVDTVNHPDLGPRVRRRIHSLFEIVHLRGRLHLTMRSIRSALAHLLFGEEDCGQIAARLNAQGQMQDSETALLGRFYYDAVAGEKRGQREDSDHEERDRLLHLLAEADMGLGANPADDSELFYVDLRSNALLPTVSGRSEYDRDLIRAMQERAVHASELADRRAIGKQVHGVLRRKAFFERPDDGWKDMLPYSMLDPMLRACQDDRATLQALQLLVTQGINQGEGIADAGEAVSLRLARGVPGEVLSFRQFPSVDFVLRPVRPAAPSDYLEYSSPALEFIYRPGANGAGAKRPTLRIDLDLLELLARMASGYAPTAAEWRGPLVNLHVFRTQLSQEPYDHLVLIDTVQERRFSVVKQGTELVLSEQGVGNGSR